MTANAPKPIRSPSYPSAPLGEAIGHVRKIESVYRTSQVDREAGAKLIGYAGLSGPANQALAALAQYGLVERAGKGEMRVTALAREVLHPNTDQEKRRSLRQAAFHSALFQELQERWPDITPPEDGVVTYLNRQGFNQSAIKPAARAYLQTLAFLEEAGASESHGSAVDDGPDSSLPEGDAGDDAGLTYGGARVGDHIQWETGGALQLERPTRVRLISDDGQWVAVDGSMSWIPMSQTIVEDRAAALAPPPPPPPAFSADAAKAGMDKDMVSLAEGVVTIDFPKDLTAASVDELAEYFEFFIKKARRRVAQ